MHSNDKPPSNKGEKTKAREEALRNNLLKRKQQARARTQENRDNEQNKKEEN